MEGRGKYSSQKEFDVIDSILIFPPGQFSIHSRKIATVRRVVVEVTGQDSCVQRIRHPTSTLVLRP